jgi:hypothetical protein
MTMPAGRPLKFKTVEELDNKINDYFTNCPDKRPVKMRDSEGSEYMEFIPCYTITGLALHLGFCDKKSLYDYQDRPEFLHSIKQARTKIELAYEMILHTGQCTGAIFALKNFGWKDKHEVEQTNLNTDATIEELKNYFST